MANPIKILELAGTDWLKGVSAQPYMSVGGLFQKATNFDPFQRVGIFIPTGDPTRYGDAQITTDINAMISYSSTVLAGKFIHAFGNGGKMYTITVVDGTTVDQSSRLVGPGSSDIDGAIEFKGKAIYEANGTVYANSLPIPRVSAEVTLLTGLNTTGNQHMKVAPDRNLYITNGNKISRVTSVTGTTDNAASYLTFEDNMAIRGLDDDGQHLIIAGDANTISTSNYGSFNLGDSSSRYRCFVAFWNMKSQDLTRVWDFIDQRVFGVISIEDEVLVFGVDNVYTCSVNSRPRVLLPLRGNSSLAASTISLSPYAIIKLDNGIVLWAADKALRGYGRLHPSLPKTFFTGYTIPDSTSFTNILSLIATGHTTNNLWASTDNERLYTFLNTTTQTSTLILAGIDFKQPYEFSFAKMVLSEKLASGQSVDLQILTNENDHTVLKNTKASGNPFSFTQVGGKKSHIFYPEQGAVAASTIGVFEDLSDIQIVNVGASVRRVEIWGREVKPNQNVYK